MKIFKNKKDIHKLLLIKKKKEFKNNFIQLTLKGIGFKLFSYKNFIAFDLGTSNIILLKNKNDNIMLKVVKNDLYIFSKNVCELNNFSVAIMSLISRNKYKGKGIFHHKEKFTVKNTHIT